ncbi:hypothetical protein [Nodularia sp. LEGE 04288]|uniref:hypothetical protein n=1 Tax=Nodularia sp. LEGE 04288 TaxID=1828639 RepID=UPI001D10CF72|nr:hypothetical protein [Nodularia sp. LEGE 04288]
MTFFGIQNEPASTVMRSLLAGAPRHRLWRGFAHRQEQILWYGFEFGRHCMPNWKIA